MSRILTIICVNLYNLWQYSRSTIQFSPKLAPACSRQGCIMSFHLKLSIISLGIVLGLFLAARAYRYFLANKRKEIYIPRIVLHSLESFVSSGEIIFHFEVKESQQVVFELCNDSFEPLMELQNKNLEDGSYTLPFDTRVVPNGEYFYRIRGAEQQVMKKFEIRN